MASAPRFDPRCERDLCGIRVARNPDHHLWRNGRLWWIAFTIHRGHLQDRIRHSLGTADRDEARSRRDEILARIAEDPGVVLALRAARPVAAPSPQRQRVGRRDPR